MRDKVKTFIHSHQKVFLYLLIILLFSLFWRFANYENRWTLSQDQARDAIIGLHMVEQKTIPFIGPPSSAGNFSFGPYYYWLIGLFTLFIPLINGPWIGFTLLSVITPLIFFLIGKHFNGNYGGLFLGLIAAFCSEFIFHSTDMLNPIPLSFFVALLLSSIIQLIDQKKIQFAFWTGLLIGVSINFHLQALGLLIFIPLTLFVNHFDLKHKLKLLVLSICGLITTFIPLLIFNFSNQNILFQNLFKYFIKNENITGLENNLISDLIVFWPQLWGTIIAHLPLLGYLFVILFLFALVFALNSKKLLSKSFYIIIFALFFQIIFLFFYQGVRSPIYLIVFHSFFVFLSGWILISFFNFQKYFALGLLSLLLIAAIPANLEIVKNNGSQISTIIDLKQSVDQIFPATVYLVSDESSNMLSLPLYYLFLKEKRISQNGTQIAVCHNNLVKDVDGVTEKWSCPMDLPVITEIEQYKIYKNDLLSAEMHKKFLPINSSQVYSWLYYNYKATN